MASAATLFRRVAKNLAAATIWRMPCRFGLASLLGREYSLRCALFHHIADTESPFTQGLGITSKYRDFEATLRFLIRHYTPVTLQQVLEQAYGRALPPRAVLVTFDDAYASIATHAAPICREFNVPAVFFVNSACLDNQRLALDNLVCYVANTMSLHEVTIAARFVMECRDIELHSLPEVFG